MLGAAFVHDEVFGSRALGCSFSDVVSRPCARLIGSGYFHENPKVGCENRAPRRKKKFIEMARTKLEPLRHEEAPREI
jgi:hypothetical protein